MITITPLEPTFGARVEGIDLSKPLSAGAIDAIHGALMRHKVIFFSQERLLEPAAQRDFAACFGTLHVHPLYPTAPDAKEVIVLDFGPDNPFSEEPWHSDVTFAPEPPMGSVLQSVITPDVGGDTMWADMVAAFEALSAPMRAFFEGLRGVHDILRGFPLPADATEEQRAASRRGAEKYPPIEHPMVRTHPVTGEKALFVNEAFTSHIAGLAPDESRAILDFVYRHISHPRFQLRHRWRQFDIAFWDNRNTQHYVLADYMPRRRRMHRATILGDRPV